MLTSQHRQEVPREAAVVFMQLAPRDPDRSPPSGVQGAISCSIPLEGRRCGVHCPSVELDDQTLGAPDAVAFVPLVSGDEPDVCLRAR
jgi:hypothetical protein